MGHNYTYSPIIPSLPPLHPSHPPTSSQSTSLGSLLHGNVSPPTHLILGSVCMLMLRSPFILLSPSPLQCPQIPSLLLCLHSFPANRLQFSSVTQSRPTLCDPMKHSTLGLPVHHQLLDSTQTDVHWVGDAIQPSHPLSSRSPSAFNLSQHHGLFKWVSSSYQVAKVLEFQLQHQSFQSDTVSTVSPSICLEWWDRIPWS